MGMEAGNSDKAVVLRIDLAAGAGNAQAAQTVADQIKKLREQAAAAGATVMQREAQATERAAQNTQAVDERVMRNRIKLIAQMQKAQEKSLQEGTAAAEKAAQEQEKIAAREAKAAEKAAAKAADAKAKEAARASRVEKDAAADTRAAHLAAAEASANAAMQQVKHQENLAAAAERAGAVRVAAENRFKEAAQGAARGALDAVRGAAILGIAGEEDLQKFIKLFAQIEGGYQLIKGLSDVWYKGRTAVLAYRAAVAAAAVEQAALNAATAAGAATGGARAATGAAGGLGALGMAGGAYTLGIGAIALAAYDVSRGNDGNIQDSGYIAKGIGASAEFLGLMQSFGALKKVTDEQTAAAKAQAESANRLVDRQNQIQSSRNAQIQGAVGIRERLSGAGRLTDQEMVGLAQQDIGAAEGRVAEAQAFRNTRGLDREQLIAADQIEAEAIGELQGAYERMADAQQSIVEARKEAIQLAQRDVELADRQIEQADRRVAQEAKSFKSRQAAFGELTASQQREVRQAAEDQAAGKLTEKGARTLQRYGFGADATTDFFAKRGQASGADDVLGKLGERSGLDEAEAELASARADRKRAEEAATAATAGYTTAVDQLIPTLEKLDEVLIRIARVGNRQFADAAPTPASTGLPDETRRRAQALGVGT